MAAYGGYSRPGYGTQGGDDSGGFFAGGSQQQGSQKVKSYQEESLRPVTIKQLLDAEEAYSGADFKIDGAYVTQVTVVGQVLNINLQPTNISFRLDDGTGQMEIKKWINSDKQDDADPGFEPGTQIRVWGHIKSFSNKRHVSAHVIRPITDFNEVNYHNLEARYVHLYYTRGPPGGAGGGGGGEAGAGDAGANEDGLFVHDGGGGNATSGKLSGCSAGAKKVYNFLNSNSSGGEGMHLTAITNTTGMSVRDVMTAADELLVQGLVYTTIDDETFAVLEY